jgi:cytochrome c oxidase subunit 2
MWGSAELRKVTVVFQIVRLLRDALSMPTAPFVLEPSRMVMALNRNRSAILVLVAVICSAAGGSARADEAERGADLFRLCAVCHGQGAEGDEAVGAPAIGGMPQWYLEGQLNQFRDGNRGTHFDDIMGMRMRPMALTLLREGDVEAVATHIAKMPTTDPVSSLTGGDAAKGKATYTTTCVACHGPDGSGNETMMGAAPLNRSSDWYLFRQIENFRDGVRGAKPGDQGGALMRPMMLPLTDEQMIKNLVAYITTLGN